MKMTLSVWPAPEQDELTMQEDRELVNTLLLVRAEMPTNQRVIE